jgi:hypothetical protein
VQGFLEFVSPTEARGWVWNSRNADKHLRVRLFLDGALLTTADAAQFRLDLKDSGIGQGDHAFAAYFTSPLAPRDCARVEAVVHDDDGARFTLPMLKQSDVVERVPRINSVEDYAPDVEQYPIFILGSARSGTTIVTHALLGSGRYEGSREGHVLDLLPSLLTAIDGFFQLKRPAAAQDDMLLSHVSQRYFDEGIANLFQQVIRQTFQSKHWIDKTPTSDMIYGAPYLLRLWPNARFIFMKRRAYENIASRLRKFPDISFEHTCEAWAHAMQAWSIVRDQLRGCAIEIDQHMIATAPDRVAAELAMFLAFGDADRVRIGQIFRNEHPERTNPGSSHVIDPAVDRFGSEDAEVFEKYCGKWLDSFHYSRDADYYTDAAEGLKTL